MGKKVKDKEFRKRLEDLLEKDSEIKELVHYCDGYDGCPSHIKSKIDEKLGIKRKTVMVRTK